MNQPFKFTVQSHFPLEMCNYSRAKEKKKTFTLYGTFCKETNSGDLSILAEQGLLPSLLPPLRITLQSGFEMQAAYARVHTWLLYRKYMQRKSIKTPAFSPASNHSNEIDLFCRLPKALAGHRINPINATPFQAS